MKIATFNVNGVNGRLSVLLRWLEEARKRQLIVSETGMVTEQYPRRSDRPIQISGSSARHRRHLKFVFAKSMKARSLGMTW